MYRRNKTNGTWVLKASDGHGAYWTKGFALADDFEDADAKNVLTFYQAQDAAKKLARGEDGSTGNAPITVDGALTAYRPIWTRATPIPTMPSIRACTSPARCWRSRWRCSRPPS